MTNRYEGADEWVAFTRDPDLWWDWSSWLWFRPSESFSPATPDVGVQLAQVGAKLVATGVSVISQDGTPLTRDDLRSLPLQALLDRAAELRVTDTLTPPETSTERPLGGAHPGRAGYDQRDFDRFSRDYLRARDLFGSKNKALKALAGPYGRDTSTLYRWVDRCIRLGLLEEGS